MVLHDSSFSMRLTLPCRAPTYYYGASIRICRPPSRNFEYSVYAFDNLKRASFVGVDARGKLSRRDEQQAIDNENGLFPGESHATVREHRGEVGSGQVIGRCQDMSMTKQLLT